MTQDWIGVSTFRLSALDCRVAFAKNATSTGGPTGKSAGRLASLRLARRPAQALMQDA
jgi:hypothetical protein